MSQRRIQPIPMHIDSKNTEENIKASKGMQARRQRILEDYLTTDGYTDSLIVDARLFRNALFTLKNKHAANAVNAKILACIDPEDWYEIMPEITVALNSQMPPQTCSDPWAYYKIQVKSASAGNAGQVTAYISEESP